MGVVAVRHAYDDDDDARNSNIFVCLGAIRRAKS